MLVSFKKMTVAKDQELRRQLREAGCQLFGSEEHAGAQGRRRYAARADGGSVQRSHRRCSEHQLIRLAFRRRFRSSPKRIRKSSALRWDWSKARSIELKDVESIANLPSREELISKVLFLINAQAQRLVTVIQAVPRNLAVVMDQVRAQKEAQGA